MTWDIPSQDHIVKRQQGWGFLSNLLSIRAYLRTIAVGFGGGAYAVQASVLS